MKLILLTLILCGCQAIKDHDAEEKRKEVFCHEACAPFPGMPWYHNDCRCEMSVKYIDLKAEESQR